MLNVQQIMMRIWENNMPPTGIATRDAHGKASPTEKLYSYATCHADMTDFLYGYGVPKSVKESLKILYNLNKTSP